MPQKKIITHELYCFNDLLGYKLSEYIKDFGSCSEEELIAVLNANKIIPRPSYSNIGDLLINLITSDSGFNRKKVLHQTQFITGHKNHHCYEAIESFKKSVDHKTGIFLKDQSNNLFYMKKQRRQKELQETTLNLTTKQYGDVDVLTDLAVQLYNEFGYLEIDHDIYFRRVQEDDQNSDWAFEYPESITDICDYVLQSQFLKDITREHHLSFSIKTNPIDQKTIETWIELLKL